MLGSQRGAAPRPARLGASSLIGATLVAGLLVAACSSTRATPSPAPTLAALAPGTHTSQAFQPAVTFTVPEGWAKPSDEPRYLQLRPVISDLVGIHLFRSPVAASQDPSCPDAPEPGVGTTAAAMADWIRGLDGLRVSSPRLASVGGLPGLELDVEIAEGWRASCPFANGLPTVPLFVIPEASFRWVVAGSEKLRLDLLDTPDGGTVVVDIDAFDGALMPDLLFAAQPIVRSMTFRLG